MSRAGYAAIARPLRLCAVAGAALGGVGLSGCDDPDVPVPSPNASPSATAAPVPATPPPEAPDVGSSPVTREAPPGSTLASLREPRELDKYRLSTFYRNEYAFTQDWFTHNVKQWKTIFAPWVGKPDLRYLEVGVWEGMATAWMFENVLTHPGSKATAADVFPDDLEARFMANMKIAGRAEDVRTIAGYSSDTLRALEPDTYDIIYVDAAHTADDVLSDAVLAWPLLKTGGVMVFDDYAYAVELPHELRPMMAVDSFVSSYRNYLEVVHRGYQIAIRKVDNPCPAKWYCSNLGAYSYDWVADRLVRREGLVEVELTADEKFVVQQLARSRPFGSERIVPPDPLKAHPGYAPLTAKLGLSY